MSGIERSEGENRPSHQTPAPPSLAQELREAINPLLTVRNFFRMPYCQIEGQSLRTYLVEHVPTLFVAATTASVLIWSDRYRDLDPLLGAVINTYISFAVSNIFHAVSRRYFPPPFRH